MGTTQQIPTPCHPCPQGSYYSFGTNGDQMQMAQAEAQAVHDVANGTIPTYAYGSNVATTSKLLENGGGEEVDGGGKW
jgi:hypothetical protein